jgi:phage-related baseplate assembly protein
MRRVLLGEALWALATAARWVERMRMSSGEDAVVAERGAARAEAKALGERIALALEALPPENATGSRDFGRGYASAIRDAARIARETT